MITATDSGQSTQQNGDQNSHPPSFEGVALVKRNDFVDWLGYNKNDQSKLRLGQLSNMVLLGRVSS